MADELRESHAAAMVDEVEECMQPGDESGSEVGELDDETMEAIASGNLPLSAETCIALNQVYQDLLQSFMRHIEACLAENREKQKTVEHELAKYSGEGVKKKEGRVPVLLYMLPYFRDSAGLAPMKNVDASQKVGELDPLVEPPRKWSPLEKKKLSKAVENALISKQTAPLVNKRDDLIDIRKACTNPDELTKLTLELREFDRRIELARSRFTMADVPTNMFESIDWTQISVAEFQASRSPVECRLMWMNELQQSLNQSTTWSADEVRNLSQLAEKYEFREWEKIAQELGTERTAFQCFEKYQSECNPNVTKKAWTKDDDYELRAAVQSCRQGEFIPWEQVADMVEGRTKYNCRIRWENVLAPGLKRGAWKEEEDLLLLHAVDRYGSKDWRRVATLVPGRNGPQCRERWSTVLTAGQRMGPWTAEEDALLVEGVRQFGRGQWAKICRLIDGRHASACKSRFRTLERRQGISAEEAAAHDVACIERNRRAFERREQLLDAYKSMAGKAPVLKNLQADAESVIRPLPTEIQAMLKDKLMAVRRRISEEVGLLHGNMTNRRQITKAVMRARLGENGDLFRRALAGGDTVIPVYDPTKPAKALADMISTSGAMLPPTSATLKALRNLLTWHGADYLVSDRPLETLAANASMVVNMVTNPNCVLTARTTTAMRGYMEDRNARESDPNRMHSDGDEALDAETVIRQILPNEPRAHRSLAELRDTTRQLFLWPAILAMMEESD